MKGSAREQALRVLYEADQRATADAGEVIEPSGGRAGRIIAGVSAERQQLDEVLESVSTNWRVERMPPVDRTILRIGLFELRHEAATPVGTIIDEAVELAKRYSTEQSGRFVNGVLAELARRERPEEATEAVETRG